MREEVCSCGGENERLEVASVGGARSCQFRVVLKVEGSEEPTVFHTSLLVHLL
jgi:hypothetical protein